MSALLLAISGNHIYYSQEARGYSLLLLLTLLSFSLFIKILKSDKVIKWHFPLLALANVCLAYTHVFGLFVIMAQVFHFILFWNKYKQLKFWFLGVQIATVAAFSPWIPTLIGRISALSHGFWITEPSLRSIVATFETYAGLSRGIEGSLPLLVLFSLLCLLGFFSIKKFSGKWNRKKPLQSIKGLGWNISLESVEEILLLLTWLFFPILIPFVISQFFSPIYLTKYAISASAAMYLLVAKGTTTFAQKKVLYPLIVVIALLSLPGLQYYYAHDVKQQWRDTSAFIEQNAGPGDVIMINPSWDSYTFSYYYKGDLERFGIDPEMTEPSEIAAFVNDATFEKSRLWFVLANPEAGPRLEYLGQTYNMPVLEKEFPGIKIFLFDLQAQP